jgi:hypothetical protein
MRSCARTHTTQGLSRVVLGASSSTSPQVKHEKKERMPHNKLLSQFQVGYFGSPDSALRKTKEPELKHIHHVSVSVSMSTISARRIARMPYMP